MFVDCERAGRRRRNRHERKTAKTNPQQKCGLDIYEEKGWTKLSTSSTALIATSMNRRTTDTRGGITRCFLSCAYLPLSRDQPNQTGPPRSKIGSSRMGSETYTQPPPPHQISPATNSLSILLSDVEGLDDVPLEPVLSSAHQHVAVVICDPQVFAISCHKKT